MKFLIELLFELIFEGSIELSSNKKISKFIRYPLIVIIILFFASVIFGLFFLGFIIYNKNIFASLFIITISVVMFILSIIKFKKLYFDKKVENKYEDFMW